MDDDFIVTVYVVVDETMAALGHRSHPLAVVSDAEVLTVAVVVAQRCQNHHALALTTMQRQGYLAGALSPSRFNRRRHALGDWFRLLLETLAELLATGGCFLIDSAPVPACQRARAGRCRTVRGRVYCGACPAKGEQVFGWRLHVVCTLDGIPVAFDLLPAGLPGALWAVTPLDELTAGRPEGATVYGDKGDNTAADEDWLWEEEEVRLVPHRKKNMWPNAWDDALAEERHTIETLFSQLAAMGLERLHVRSVAGLELKVHASLLALTCARAASQSGSVWMVRFATLMPSFPGSPRMRSSPQSGFSAAIRRMRVIVSDGSGGRPGPGRDFRRQRARNPAQCQRSSVSG